MSKSPPSPPDENTVPESDIQRWTARRKAAVVLDLIRGRTTAGETARLHGLTIGEIERWREDFTAQGTEGLHSHPRDLAERWNNCPHQ